MFVIPIGTKSSLALKPKITIGLIAANVVVALVTVPLMIRTESQLFRVQRARFAKQIRLFADEHPRGAFALESPGLSLDQSLQDLEDAKDFRGFQFALFESFAASGLTPEAFEHYGDTLEARGEEFYLGSEHDASFHEWKTLRERERAVIEGSVLNQLGLVPARMSRVHTFITHMFLHEGIWHLVGNMLFLWIVGCLLEDSWGRIPFLLFFTAGGVVAGLVHCLQDTASYTPLVGASGAIAAAMGAFTVRHFWTRIKFFYFVLVLFRPYAGTFYLPAFVFLPLWFAAQLVLHYLSTYLGGASNVAYMAHIGGFSAGLLAALGMRLTGFEERFLAPSVRKTQVAAGVLKDPRFDKACTLLERGNVDEARCLFNELLAARPDDADLIQDITLLYREKGLEKDCAALEEATLKVMIRAGKMEEASRFILETIQGRRGAALDVPCLMRVAKWLGEEERHGDAHDVYRSILSSSPPPNVAAKASLALAKLLSGKMSNARDALEVLEDARRMPLDAEWLDTIAALEDEIEKVEVLAR